MPSFKVLLKHLYDLAQSRFDPELEEAVETLKEELIVAYPVLDVEDGFLWRYQGGYKDGPFCAKTWEEKRMLKRVEWYSGNVDELISKR